MQTKELPNRHIFQLIRPSGEKEDTDRFYQYRNIIIRCSVNPVHILNTNESRPWDRFDELNSSYTSKMDISFSWQTSRHEIESNKYRGWYAFHIQINEQNTMESMAHAYQSLKKLKIDRLEQEIKHEITPLELIAHLKSLKYEEVWYDDRTSDLTNVIAPPDYNRWLTDIPEWENQFPYQMMCIANSERLARQLLMRRMERYPERCDKWIDAGLPVRERWRQVPAVVSAEDYLLEVEDMMYHESISEMAGV